MMGSNRRALGGDGAEASAARRLISSLSTAAHFRVDSGTDWANVLLSHREVTQSGVPPAPPSPPPLCLHYWGAGELRAHPHHLAALFATLAFKIMSLAQERHFSVHSCTPAAAAAAAAVSSKNTYFSCEMCHPRPLMMNRLQP